MGIKVTVIGAGTMGHALALVYALGGHEVRLTDSSMAVLDRAGGLMEAALATLVAQGEASAAATPEWLAQAVTRLPMLAEALNGAELVVEAISENPEAKRALYAEYDRLAPRAAILASNTSYLDVFPLIPERRLDRSLIMHWYTPPYLVDLVDIVGAPGCDPRVVEFAGQLCRALGKVPVVMKKFVPGYIANRVQSAIGLEVQKLLDEGVASAEEIDTAIIEGIALRLPILGVLAKADFTGLGFMQASLANRMYEPPPVRGRCDTLDGLVAGGRSGVMAGAGFYDWAGRNPAELFEARDRKLVALKRALREIGSLAGQQREES